MPKFIQGVIDFYNGLRHGDRSLIVHAYETWGFCGLSNDLIDVLNIWAKFIYGLMLDDRIRTIADQVEPGKGAKRRSRCIRPCATRDPSAVPREFVYAPRRDRVSAACSCISARRWNFHTLFNEAIAGVDVGNLTLCAARRFCDRCR